MRPTVLALAIHARGERRSVGIGGQRVLEGVEYEACFVAPEPHQRVELPFRDLVRSKQDLTQGAMRRERFVARQANDEIAVCGLKQSS